MTQDGGSSVHGTFQFPAVGFAESPLAEPPKQFNPADANSLFLGLHFPA
jgi:hypothetical protein